VPFVAMVGFLGNVDKKTPLEFSASGQVTIVSWEGTNHGMPMFVIKENNVVGNLKKLESHEILLKPSQIKVGDYFEKVAGSKYCNINNAEIQCIK
jgi:hypothetical protein